ncbi:DNA-binding transcriptional regulator YhcF, GntR family [Frankineae bacterium MT45]|nr:DNA-binding transcriptional regulator YhcF, GntR family [Frankineae bacterium MT45]
MPPAAELLIDVDPAAATPPFEQIRAQIAAQVSDGVLPAGFRLPPVRQLAETLGLAVNTVARSYRELESAGVVETRGRGGTVVTAGGDQARQRLQEQAQGYAEMAHDLGVTPAEAQRIVLAAIDAAR